MSRSGFLILFEKILNFKIEFGVLLGVGLAAFH